MNNVKKALVAAGALMVLAGQVQAQSLYPTDPPGAAAGYAQFGNELHSFCHMPQPFEGSDGNPRWICTFHDNRPDPGIFISFTGSQD